MSLEMAKKVLMQEAEALRNMAGELDDSFLKAVDMISEVRGKVVVMGIGKSGLVGQKISATLSSTGTPALFLHAGESLHGDLGVVEEKDIVLVFSMSGSTDEISLVLPALKNIKVPIVAFTGDLSSRLAASSSLVIKIKVEREACPMNLVPTTSTTVMLAVGDALALSLLRRKGFKPEDFASFHPGGALGRRLLTSVGDIISRAGVNPAVKESDSVKEALLVMTASRVGAASVVDSSGRLAGYFTDGDLRRWVQKDSCIMDRKISAVMTAEPMTVSPDTPAVRAKEIMQEKKFDNMPVVNEKREPVGIIDERDIIREGI
ncbi:MAG: KpsF/GutQ family sugar-phosphate isomerase [Elusimicrobiota bacterium]